MSSAESPPQDLGRAQLDADDDHVSLPEDLDDWDVLSPGSEAYWAWDPSNDRLLVTRSQRSLDEYAEFNRVAETRVSDDGAIELPEACVTGGDEYPWSGLFADGSTVYFDAPGDLLDDQLVYVLPEAEHEALWNE